MDGCPKGLDSGDFDYALTLNPTATAKEVFEKFSTTQYYANHNVLNGFNSWNMDPKSHISTETPTWCRLL